MWESAPGCYCGCSDSRTPGLERTLRVCTPSRHTLPWPLSCLAGYTVSQRSLHIMGWASYVCTNLPLTPMGPMCQWGSTWEFPRGTPLGKSNWLWEGHVSSPYMLPIGCTIVNLRYIHGAGPYGILMGGIGKVTNWYTSAEVIQGRVTGSSLSVTNVRSLSHGGHGGQPHQQARREIRSPQQVMDARRVIWKRWAHPLAFCVYFFH